MTHVLVVGAGLIGTSLGLALRHAGHDTVLDDADPRHLATAVRRGAGGHWDGTASVDIAVVAVPPLHIAQVLHRLQSRDVALTYTHVSSVQSHVQREVEALGCDASRIVGGHPLAGRETSGPEAAVASLFVGRPWAVCPSSSSASDAIDAVTALAQATGAAPLVLAPDLHDRAVALLSHLPQVASSALAALLTAAPDLVATGLSGPGLTDTTRLAASDPHLWTDILAANAGQVAPVTRALAAVLDELASHLEVMVDDPEAPAQVRSLLARGNAGRATVPVKRGVVDASFGVVDVDVDDRPGQLAALLAAAGDAEVNVEDVRVDHVPGRPTGVISLVVRREAATALRAVLKGSGWRVLRTEDDSPP